MVAAVSLSFPVPLGAYEGSPAKDYLSEEVLLPEGGITYRLNLPLLETDTLTSLVFTFNVKGGRGSKLTVSTEGLAVEVPTDGEVSVGYDGKVWYVAYGGHRKEGLNAPPGRSPYVKLVPKGKVVLWGETLGVRLTYRGEPIRRVRVGDILDSPKKYDGKRVLLVVSPGGWSCPAGRGTPIPEGFSRSATTLYDPTGCIYGGGHIVAGRILSPDLHTINLPGREKVVVVGRVKMDGRGTPYLTP